MIIKNIIAIFQKEFQSYFKSPLAYIVAGIYWLIAGIFMVNILLGEEGIIQQVAYSEQLGIPLPPVDVPYTFLTAFFSVLGSLCLFILPILSMGLYTEERKAGTLELLVTSPISNWVIALGKLLGVVAFFMFMIMPFLFYEAIIFSASEPAMPFAVALSAHLGLILLATAILSWGMFISSLTDSNIISAVLTFALILFFWIVDILANNFNGAIADFLRQLSLIESYNNLINGIWAINNIVLLLSYIFLGIFFTAQSVEMLRYKQ